MTITVNAVFENGTLRPMEPLPLAEHARVRVTIQPIGDWVNDSYGICGWKGSSEELRRLALSPDLEFEEE
jgi:predicted DNA-binding antitoxin AbrB/MazE fold protein